MKTHSTRSTRSLQDRVIDVEKVDNGNPVRFLASCLFFSIHVSSASKIIGNMNLGSGAHQKLEYNMYEIADSLKTNGFDYMQRCHKLYCDTNNIYMKLEHFIETLLDQFADSRLLKKMKRENYSSLFRAILYRASSNYISELKKVSQTLYAYDDVAVYSEYCTKFMHKKLISAIETSVHLLLDDSARMVPVDLYEIVKKDRDKLFLKYKKLNKKYRRLKAELEE
jgi:hypothetical protein